MSDSKLHKEKGKTRRGIYGDDTPEIVDQYFDRKCGKIDGKLHRNKLREKELKKPIEVDEEEEPEIDYEAFEEALIEQVYEWIKQQEDKNN